MTKTEYPERIYERAAVLMNECGGGVDWTPELVRELTNTSLKALLAHIHAHEPAPVDPLLHEAELLARSRWTTPKDLALRALKRGQEIGREGRS